MQVPRKQYRKRRFPGCSENGCVESFNGKLRNKLLKGKLFLSLEDARWMVDRWRIDYNHHRPHSGLDYMYPRYVWGWLCSSGFRYAQFFRT